MSIRKVTIPMIEDLDSSMLHWVLTALRGVNVIT